MKSVNYTIKLFVLALFLFAIPLVSSATLSMSEATINSDYFGFEKAWVVSMVADDYTTDYLSGYFSPQKIEDETGIEAKQGIDIKVETDPSYCTYSFKTNAFKYQDVYTIEPVILSKWLWGQSDLDELNAQAEEICADFSDDDYKLSIIDLGDRTYDYGDYVYGEVTWGFKTTLYCVKLNEKIGTIAQPIDKTIVSDTEWTVEVDGKPDESKIISNSDAGAGRSSQIGSNVWVQWQGYLTTGEDCPDVSNSIGIHNNAFTTGWRLGSRDNYNDYRSYISNGLKLDIRQFAESSYPDEYMNAFREDANEVMRQAVDEDVYFTYSALDTSLSNGKIKIDLGKNIVFPLFRLIIDSDYLELNIPNGKPKIESVSSIEFTEGLAGQMNAVVRNIGEGEGGFTARVVDCTSGFASSTLPLGLTLQPDESKSISFNIIGTSTAEESTVSGTCTLELTESTTGESVRNSFGVKMTQLQQCNPGSKACASDVTSNSYIKVCNQEGTQYEVSEICSTDKECKLVDGEPKCVEKEGGGVVELYCEDCNAYVKDMLFGWMSQDEGCVPKTFQNKVFCLPALLKMLAVPLAFILSLIFGITLLRKWMKDQNPALIWLLNIVIAAIIAFVVYLYFWLGVILFALWVLIKLFVRIPPIPKLR